MESKPELHAFENYFVKKRKGIFLPGPLALAFISDFCMFALFDTDINLRLVQKRKDFDSDLLLSKTATVKNNLKQLHKGCFN